VEAPPRVATLVLVTSDARLVGALPPFEVDTPWWQDVAALLHAAREHHGPGLRPTILRVLETERPSPPGGAVTYLAEITSPVAAEPWPGTLDDHPLRLPWARPGGPACDLAWAEAELAERGMRRTGPAEQMRTWNLSSLWHLPVEGQSVWLKVVPPFFAHEGRMLAQLQGRPGPTLLARDDAHARLLMAEMPGADLYVSGVARLREMVTLLVGLQREWIGRSDRLLALGLPDWRAAALGRAIASVVERTADELSPEDRTALAGFVSRLAERFAQVSALGLPDTLVHGDFHPGNLRGDESTLVLLDWGDCGVGHPLLDQPAFLARVPRDDVVAVREHWHRVWRSAVPGSEPDRAARLLAPIAAARQAVIFRAFLDGI
jgi:hypothetical protein